ncbi:LNS2 (Lipin/Ned1/Smp2) family protein [Babesia bovis T2Bo]|uniref:phosphatidate phosphatase n=1 Tax=Babesia bovis TaxID=5865 RepID=A7AT25_BABBO|nr:LNS2 (Lipin/Ned1/Smp2) family protein [Babesia bovis T2Bo]EDO06086.1 LNS2 (Lipin/Ned1/Smp2) family protein [Babesia bovis T2Bo]|eukprot:XP_001609654.1 hypothetical protein [Babesia bovis T2Bo]
MWEKLYSSVVNVLDFNQATLSGCVDIICVRHKEVVADGGVAASTSSSNSTSELKDNERWVYRSTPFHVRFGKAKLLKSREKTVSIYVNGELSNLTMKLGAAGEAFFDEETTTDGDDGPLIAHQLSEISAYSEGEDVGQTLMDYGYYACSNSRYKMRTDVNEVSVPASAENAHGSDVESGKLTDRTTPKSDRSAAPPSKYQSACSTQEGAPPRFDDTRYSREASRVSDDGYQLGWRGLSMTEESASADPDDQILQFSLCGHLLTSQDEALNEQFFSANIVDWERLNSDPSLWYHASLVARFDNRPPYYPSKIALPLLASWIVFKRPLSGDAIASLLRTTVVATSMSPAPSLRIASPDMPKSNMASLLASSHGVRRYRVSIRPTSDQLASLNLQMGVNRITFTVNSSLQGTKSVHARLYMWPSDARIVISDVDGTITKSDALGHIMPILGKDWSHTGVAELFTKIRSHGYHVVYLTARAIGQADYTREYLFGLTQNKKSKLPQGPLFLSPDRLLPSFKREVISRSAYMFKIPALRDIRNLFPPGHNPFYAGFGNNESDHRAYVSVGVPENRVFIINSSGIIRHVNSTDARTYQGMSDISELMFPPCHNDVQYGSDDERGA